MAEVKYAHQNVGFEATDLANGKIKVTNRFYFTGLKDYAIRYAIRANGKTLRDGRLTLDLAPQASQEISVPVAGLKPDSNLRQAPTT